jgi:hypothetical protein
LAWINGILQTSLPRVVAAATITGPYQDLPEAVIDANAKTATFPAPPSPRFYRLLGCVSTGNLHIRLNGGMVILTYQ